MSKIGLVAGGGMLPVEFARAVKEKGDKAVVYALKDMASPVLEEIADKIYWLGLDQYKLFIFYLIKERIRKIALLGKFEKNLIYEKDRIKDETVNTSIKKLGDRKDYSILEEATRHLARFGVTVIPGGDYLSHLIPEKGVLGAVEPSEEILADINFAFDTAKKVSGMDIGQTVIVKHKAVVAVEAMEGTDRTIARASSVAGKGCVMVKVSRPEQDSRWDVPVVGADTIKVLAEHGFSALALESGSMYLVDRASSIDIANRNGIAIVAL
jgi:hypothetical protein